MTWRGQPHLVLQRKGGEGAEAEEEEEEEEEEESGVAAFGDSWSLATGSCCASLFKIDMLY
jgi:hypothetical protein